MERDFCPELIFVTEKAAQQDRTQDIIAQYQRAEVRRIKSVLHIRAPQAGLKPGIEWGKRVLVISDSRKFVERFVNDDPGAVCPTFRKLTPATHCPFDCQFCFLQGTYRTLRPWVCVYTDLFKMLFQVDMAMIRQHLSDWPQEGPAVVFNAGEMCDSLASLRIVPGLLRELVEYFGKLEDARLLLLTKSAKVEELVRLEHNGNTIAAWSLNCDRVTRDIELGTASLDERLAAARACQEAGYPVRFRFDPLIRIPDWREQYGDMVERTLEMVEPERITLGSFRLLGNLRSIIEGRFPDSELLRQHLERDGKRLRYPHEARKEMYEFVVEQIRRQQADVPVSICKETPRMWRELGHLLTPRCCNCLP